MEQKTEQKVQEQKASNKIENSKKSNMIAIVLIRGRINLSKELKDTLDMLHLHNKHYCSVYQSNPTLLGMLRKVKDYVTYGEISDETYKMLKEKRQVKDKKFFRLAPPVGGFERGGIKQPFGNKGALGYRGDKINDLLKKMM